MSEVEFCTLYALIFNDATSYISTQNLAFVNFEERMKGVIKMERFLDIKHNILNDDDYPRYFIVKSRREFDNCFAPNGILHGYTMGWLSTKYGERYQENILNFPTIIKFNKFSKKYSEIESSDANEILRRVKSQDDIWSVERLDGNPKWEQHMEECNDYLYALEMLFGLSWD